MRRHEILVIICVVVMCTFFSVNAGIAHPTTAFHACTAHSRSGGECSTIGAAFAYGDTVWIRGKVRSAHSQYSAAVLRRNPHSSNWRTVDQVPISDYGKMRFSWRTTQDDAVQDAPYVFKFKIRGHGSSNRTQAFVLFGE